MAINYQIKGDDNKFKEKYEVCRHIVEKQIKDYVVYEKDDATSEARRDSRGYFMPIPPECKDITQEIVDLIPKYKE